MLAQNRAPGSTVPAVVTPGGRREPHVRLVFLFKCKPSDLIVVCEPVTEFKAIVRMAVVTMN